MERRPLARYLPPVLLAASCAEEPPPHESDIGGDMPDGAPVITVEPAEIVFGEVPLGAEVVEGVAIGNEGDADLHIQNIEFEDGDEGLSIAGVGSVLVPPGNATTFDVVFTPETPGAVDDWVLIDSDDPQAPVARIPVSGEGVEEP